MRSTAPLLVAGISLILSATAHAQVVAPPPGAGAPPPPPPPGVSKAVAVLHATAGNKVAGTITFTKDAKGLRLTGDIEGLAPGKHAFHVHEFGDCSAPDGTSAGNHFNPTGEAHGSPTDPVRHTGDFGNLEAGADGKAKLDYTDAKATFEGTNSVLGRGFIIHAKADDLKTQPGGDAGARIACAVIGVSKP